MSSSKSDLTSSKIKLLNCEQQANYVKACSYLYVQTTNVYKNIHIFMDDNVIIYTYKWYSLIIHKFSIWLNSRPQAALK